MTSLLACLLVTAAWAVQSSTATARTDDAKKPVIFFVSTQSGATDCTALFGSLESAIAAMPIRVGEDTQHFERLTTLSPAPDATNCDTGLPQGPDTVKDVAHRLATWLAKTYTEPVDVVAEGTSGVAVRYALGMSGEKNWPKLDVEDVVTLGSPHGSLTGALFDHPDGTQGTDWSVIGAAGDTTVDPAASAIAMDAEHKTTYTDAGLTHLKLLHDVSSAHDAHIVYQHEGGKPVTWYKAPHVAERVAQDLVNGVDSCGLDAEQVGDAAGSCASACKQRVAGWTLRFECPRRDELDAGAPNVTITSPDALHGTAIPDIPGIETALPLASSRRLALPVLLPDLEIHAGGFTLTAFENTLDADGLTIGVAGITLGELGQAVAYGLQVKTNGTIKADSLELEALGGSIEAEGVTFEQDDGLRADSATLGLPPTAGGGAVTFSRLRIGPTGSVSGTVSGGRVTIGDITAEISRAAVTDEGFTIGDAQLVLPDYLGGAKLHARNLTWDGKAFSLEEAEGDVDFAVAGGKLRVAAHVTFRLLANGGYELAGSGRVVAPGDPPSFQAAADVAVKSVDCDPAPGACRNAVYLERAALSIAIDNPIPLGSTGLAIRGLSGQVDAAQDHPRRDADGTVEGVSYTFTLGANIVSLPNTSVFDGTVTGSLSTNGNFGLSVNGTALRFIHLHGGMCVLFTNQDTVCEKHISADHRSQVTGTGAFVDASATATVSYTGSAGSVNAALKARAFGRVVHAGGQTYIDAEIAGSVDASAHSFLLPDVQGSGTISAKLGRFYRADRGSVLGVKGTLDVQLTRAGGGEPFTLKRAIFIDQNGNYTEENVEGFTLAEPAGRSIARSFADTPTAAGVPPYEGRTTAEDDGRYDFELPPRQTQTAIVLQADDGTPSLEVTTPGDQEAAIDHTGSVRPVGHGDHSDLTNIYAVDTTVAHSVIAYVRDAQPGRWGVRVRGATAGHYRLSVSGSKPLPQLTVGRPSRRSPATVRQHHGTTISGTLRGVGTRSTLSVYAGRGDCAARGAATLLATRVQIHHNAWHYRWKSITVPPGRYAIHAQLDNGTGPLVRTCAARAILVKAKMPRRPKQPRHNGHRHRNATRESRRLVGERTTAGRIRAAALRGSVSTATEPKPCSPQTGAKPDVPIFWVSTHDIDTADKRSNMRAIATPDIARNDATAIQKDHQPILLHYGPYSKAAGCKAVARQHRREACGKRPFKPGGKPGPPDKEEKKTSCDEYPFASTLEGGRKAGGKAATIAGVRLAENLSQGGQLSGFLQRNANELKQLDGRFYVCVELNTTHQGKCE